MAKFNEVAKMKRAAKSERKRAIHGDPLTGKLKARAPVLSVSGKRQKKLLRKWRREQKDMVEKGLVTMDDLEMASAEASEIGTPEDSKKTTRQYSVKKSLKLSKLKKIAGNKKSQKANGEGSADRMLE